jgi:hypothetical protein
MNTFSIKAISYPERRLLDWRKKEYGWFERSDASSYLRRVLCAKAKNRPGTRFFGEAFVSATQAHSDGWYGSFKWLTSPGCLKISGSHEARDEFVRALADHFGSLEMLQDRAQALATKLGENPVPPDLWLIGQRCHHFIEVKLPWDSVAERQLAGLALIARHLRGRLPVSVSVIQLYPESEPKPSDSTLDKKFRHLYRLAGTA